MLNTAWTATRHLDMDRDSIDLRNRQSELALGCSSVIRVRLEAKTNEVMQKRNELKEAEHSLGSLNPKIHKSPKSTNHKSANPKTPNYQASV